MSGPACFAIVRSKSNMDRSDRPLDTVRSLIAAREQYPEHRGVSFEVVAWDEPQDWARFTHIVLGCGIEYASCKEKFLAWLTGHPADIARRLLNSPGVIQWNLDKIYLLDLKGKGIRIPHTVFVRRGDGTTARDVERALTKADAELTEIVVKERIDAGGHSSRRVKLQTPGVVPEGLLEDVLQGSRSGVIIQRYLPAIITEGEWSVVFFVRALSHTLIKTPSGGEFRVQSRYGGRSRLVPSEAVPKDILELAERVVAAVPREERLFYARVDIVRDEEGVPCLMELEAFEPDLYLYSPQITKNYLDGLQTFM